MIHNSDSEKDWTTKTSQVLATPFVWQVGEATETKPLAPEAEAKFK